MYLSDGKTLPAEQTEFFFINLHSRLPLWVVPLQREVGACNWALKYAFLPLTNCSFLNFLRFSWFIHQSTA